MGSLYAIEKRQAIPRIVLGLQIVWLVAAFLENAQQSVHPTCAGRVANRGLSTAQIALGMKSARNRTRG